MDSTLQHFLDAMTGDLSGPSAPDAMAGTDDPTEQADPPARQRRAAARGHDDSDHSGQHHDHQPPLYQVG